MNTASGSSARERYQAGQRPLLAPYAVADADSGGRAFAEAEHPYRGCFQRDRDRIVHCTAFRRLDFKTQVFVPHEHDHFRTRLTHTLEVAQIGRTLGRALGLNEDLIEAVALAHDLGHPPFGHAGEVVLSELMADHGRFEHNRQSLRAVDYLEHPYPQFRGLNLTRVVRECLAKHQTPYDTPACEEFDAAHRAPLEGQMVDRADEIAFTSADLEDALSAGWVAVDELAGLDLWRRGWQQAQADAPDAQPIHKRIRACKGVLAAMADDLLAAAAANLARLGIDSADAARRAGETCAAFSGPVAEAVKQMQQFLLDHVYLSPRSAGKGREARRIIRELFEAYVERPELLPQRYGRRVEADGLHRVACDYVAGMTDRFCRAEHARICGGRNA
jgi:dGTPase